MGDYALWPVLQGEVGYRFTSRLTGALQAAGFAADGQHVVDASLDIRYRFNRHWDMGGGYEYFSNNLQAAEISNQTVYNTIFLSFGYTF